MATPTPITGDAIWLYTIHMRMFNQVCLNTFTLQRSDKSSTTDYVTTANDFLEWQGDTVGQSVDLWTKAMTAAVVVESLTMQPIYPTRYSQVPRTLTPIAGVLTGQTTPSNVAAVITKVSDVAKRWGRGSVHLPGQQASEVGTGNWGTATLSRLADIKALLNAGFAQGGGQPGWSLVLWTPRTPTRITPVTYCVVQPTVRVMRRRTVRLGI